jgi:2-dehydro-3-deoxygluconokinase
MKKICCFGELLLRMSPAFQGEWIRKANMPVYIGGAELNVAQALAQWHQPVKYVTAMPGHALSREICEELRTNKIDTSCIHFSGDHIGIYFLPQGADLKHAGVIYDRSHSSFAWLRPGSLDWDHILHDVSWFHFSAISPALNEDAVSVCKEGIVAASQKGITVSVDLNYRPGLWQYGKNPRDIMPALVEHCEVVMGNIWSANSLLGMEIDEDIHHKKNKTAYLRHATETSKLVMRRFPKCKAMANTFRFDEQEGIRYYAAINSSSGQFVSPEFLAGSIIDRVGSGDCFMAGLIYGLSNEWQFQQTVNFAAAAAFGKLQEKGDATRQTKEQIFTQLAKADIH